MTNLFTENEPSIDPEKDYYTELVGPDKKYKDNTSLARSKIEADLTIKRREAELENLRKELNTRLNMETFLEKLTTPTQDNQNHSNGTNGTQNPNSTSENPLKPEDIERLVEERLTKAEQERIQTRNLEEVKSQLLRSFGNDYVSKLQETASQLGMDQGFLNNLAKTQPKAFLKLVGASEQAPSTKNELFTPPSTHQTSFTPTANKRNWKYYEDLRVKDPKTYWTPSTQNQMHKDAMEMVEAFYS